jgi:hypothetical protein
MESTLLDPQIRTKMACLDGMMQSVDTASRIAHSSIENSLFEFVRQCRAIRASEKKVNLRTTASERNLN